MFEDAQRRIGEHLTPLLQELDLEVFDFTIHHRNKNIAVSLSVDHLDGGVTIEECAFVNKKIAELLEIEKLLGDRFTVEVSSPGLDRPLKTHNDFRRVKGRMVKFHLIQALENKLEHDGIVQDVIEEGVSIETKHKVFLVPFVLIQKAVEII